MATSGVSYQAFSETYRGSLEIGKAADMVWLEQDIRNVDVLSIPDVHVLGTWLSGRRVYER